MPPLRPPIQAQAARERARRAQERIDKLSLLDFVPAISPWLSSPYHLKPIADLFEAAERGAVSAVTSTPPQHGKTELILHGLAWLSKRCPGRSHAYATYSAERAGEVSDRFRQIAESHGLEPRGRRMRLVLRGGGAIRFVGVNGPLTGSPVTGMLVVDDPIKNRVEAESAAYRRLVTSWFSDVALTRCHPETSKIINMTRWHVDDLVGQRLRAGWDSINLQAINEVGEALWPEQHPLEFLLAQQTELGGPNSSSWVGLYQGQPRARGGHVFEGQWTYDELPSGPLRWAFGVDLAYSETTHNDWSVIVVLAMDHERNVYVVDVVRDRRRAEQFADSLSDIRRAHPTAKARWYGAGSETGVAGLMNRLNPQLKLEYKPASADKLVRALPVSAAWNTGRVFIPSWGPPWYEAFWSELRDFTGLQDIHDDQVDALAAGFDALDVMPKAVGTGAVVSGRSRFAGVVERR